MVDLTCSAPDLTHEDLAEQLLRSGCRVLQLRYKNGSSADVRAIARRLQKQALRWNAHLVINDYLQAARSLAGVGVHLGQDDPSPRVARRLLGPDCLIGVSTHDLRQARDAVRLGADYIGFGPIYSARTKGTDEAAVGVLALQRVARHVSVPVVAIGGIQLGDVPVLVRSGASAVATIGAVAGQSIPSMAARAFVRRMEQCL